MTQQSRPTLLLTRPLAQSQRFGGEVAARFGAVDVVISPLLAPRFLPAVLPSGVEGVIFTSETGVAGALAAGMKGQGQPAFCVGARTAQAAQSAGYDARGAGGDWQDIAALITRAGAPKSLTFLCAQEAPSHLQTALIAAGFHIQRIDVYAQDAQPLCPEATALLAGKLPVLLPIFSPRSAQVFCAQARPKAPIYLAAFSEAVANGFTLPHARQVVAHRPNSAALLDAMAELLE